MNFSSSPIEEADIERFPNGAKVEEIVIKEHGQKSKLFASMLGRERTVVKRVVVDMLFLHFIAYVKISWEAVQQLISNSIDSQDDSSEALESAASDFSSTVSDVIGFVDDYEKSRENAAMMQLMRKK